MKKHRIGIKKWRTAPSSRFLLFLSSILVIVITYYSLEFVDHKITPTIVQIADRKTKEFATRGIYSAVKFAEEYSFDI